jgi:hypothetical protein
MKRKHETRTEFSEGMEVQRDEGRGKTLLGDNTSHRAVVKLRPIRLQCVGVWI